MNVTIPLESETLTPEEVKEITGRARRDQQCQWLRENGWHFTKNAAGIPVVGRLYARWKLAGVELSVLSPTAESPDFSKVR